MQTDNRLIHYMIITTTVMFIYGCAPIKTSTSEIVGADKVTKQAPPQKKSQSPKVTKQAPPKKKSQSPKVNKQAPPKIASVSKDKQEISVSGIISKSIIRNGKPEGPLQAVAQVFSGTMQVVQNEIARGSEGRPETGTVAIAKPYKDGEKVVLLSLESSELLGSNYEGRKLVIEIDAMDMKGLFGEGAIYLIPPGIKKLRLGNYYVSTSGLNNWSSVQMAGSSTPPTVLDNKIRVWSVLGGQ